MDGTRGYGLIDNWGAGWDGSDFFFCFVFLLLVSVSWSLFASSSHHSHHHHITMLVGG